MKNVIIITMMLLSFTLPIAGAEKDSIHFRLNPPFAEILKESRETGKPIFIDGYTWWCGWCKWMDQNMFTNDSVAEFYNDHFICAKYDMEKGEGPMLMDTFNLQSTFPIYLFIDGNGKVLDSTVGAIKNPGSFIDFGRDVVNQRQYNPVQMSQSELLSHMSMLKNQNKNTDLEADIFFGRQTDPMDSLSWFVIRNYAGERTVAFDFLTSHRKAFYDKYNADTVDLAIQLKYALALSECIQAKPVDTTGYKRVRNELTDPDHYYWFAEEMAAYFDLAYYWRLKEWEAYGYAANTFVLYYADSNWAFLNEIAWKIYQDTLAAANPQLIELAVQWAARSVELNENYYNLDTYGCILYKAGKVRKAKKVLRRAIRVAKKYNASSEVIQNNWQIDYSPTKQVLDSIRRR